MTRRVRFERWSGTQDPFGPDLSPDEVLDALRDDLLHGVAPEQALADLLRRGLQGRVMGLDELRARLADAQRADLERMGLEGPLTQVAERLAEILELERTALQFLDDEQLAAQHVTRLDRLPEDPAGRIGGLEDYDWVDGGARDAFAALLDDLRADVAAATFGDLAGALGQARPEDLARMRAMLDALNGLIHRRDDGHDITADFAEFKRRYGDLLPGDPETLDDLLEELARRMAAMSRLLAGLEPGQRAQLQALAGKLLGDLGLQAAAARLASSLQARFPGMGWDTGPAGAQPTGASTGSLARTVDWVEHLQQQGDLARALRQDYPGARLEDIDGDALRAALGPDAAADLRALRRIEQLLEESGALRRERGRLQLTPRGVRRLGEQTLGAMFARALHGGVGEHAATSVGGDTELTGATRPLRFGDPFRPDVSRTIVNAVARGGARPGGRVELSGDDFALAEAERRVRAATVLLLDMSFSMPLRGNWEHAKRMALALQSLVSSRFPQDSFYLVGFSDYARRLQPRDLLVSGWERVWGTNMQHAFRIARRLLGAHTGAHRQVIMVTDGEPTARLEGAQSLFAWPPDPRTLQVTMAEARRLARTGTALNVFLLDHDPGAARFVEQMVAGVGGRIFYPDLADLGRVVVRDFLRHRT